MLATNGERLKIGTVSLGCDKNRVDTEVMLGDIGRFFDIVNDPEEADILIVNTCGFIESSKQESIDTILEMAEYKNRGKCKVLIATGCLTQRYGEELKKLIPELDIILGTNNYNMLYSLINEKLSGADNLVKNDYSDKVINEGERVLTTPNHFAYVRIAEGCSNFCTYCVIPKIRGKYRSRRMESILEEAKKLAASGVKEIILVAQDTTKYGTDIYGEKRLVELLRKLSKIEGLKWIRLMYCYPEEITEELIYEIRDNDKVLKYLDIPIQHISNRVLKRMNRRSTKELVTNLIDKLRTNIPEIVIRTSIIVGFPGETDEDFNELCEFIRDAKLDKMGVFTFSNEEGSAASLMENQIDEEVKESRKDKLMMIQQQISKNINAKKMGKIYKVLVDELSDDNLWIGRSYEMAPEIDGNIIINCNDVINQGCFINVKIESALEYDLVGVVYNESSK